MPKHFQVQDHFTIKAKERGFRARSVFKLEEIQDKFHILSKEDTILDLGAAPGSWLQYIAQTVGTRGLAIGIDIREIEPFREKNIVTFVGDILDEDAVAKNLATINIEKCDVVLSDLAPDTSGIPGQDQERSLELALEAARAGLPFLKKGGNLVLKIFEGEELMNFRRALEERFSRVKAFRPKASRSRSKEIYLVCLDKK